jgi:cyclic pyranopterin phosphate synthase
MAQSKTLTHLDASGTANMVDVSAKPATERTAVAVGAVVMKPETLAHRARRATPRKATCSAPPASPASWPPSAPMNSSRSATRCCSPRSPWNVTPDDALPGVRVSATVKVSGQTGVEMEALTAVSVACLTVYDMVKAVDRGMRIEAVRLVEKTGGASGSYRAE